MKLKQIIEEAQKRDERAQKALFMTTHKHLMSTVLRYVPEKSSGEDILQETYIRIFQHLPKFTFVNDSATMGWMRRIAATEAIRYLKSRDRWNSSFQVDHHSSTKPVDSLASDEIYKMLLDLPDNQRLVFNLYIIEGYSHKEIAGKLGLVESSSRALLSRARTSLQLKFQKNTKYERA